MRKLLVVLAIAVLISSSVFAQSIAKNSKPVPQKTSFKIPVIKGHRIGETLAQFKKLEPEICAEQLCDDIEHGSSGGLHRMKSDNLIFWGFDGGKLSIMELGIEATFESLVSDMGKRIGTSPTFRQADHENASGESWTDRDALWIGPAVSARVVENNNPTGTHQAIVLVWKNKKEAPSKGPLD